MWNELILVKWNILYCTSRDIAKNFLKEHKTVLRAIENLWCSKEFWQLHFVPWKYNKRWKEYKEYYITRDWFSILVMWFTWKEAMQFKEKYINAFNKMEKALNSITSIKTLPEYEKIRLEWKQIRRTFTDTIQLLEKYALEQNPEAITKFLYATYTKALNNWIFDIEWKFKNVRDVCNIKQLRKLSLIEDELVEIIIWEIEKETPYKDIYYIVKQKIEWFVNLFWKTKIIYESLELKPKNKELL